MESRIAAVQKSISELDDSVAKATEMRQKQHSDFVTLTANNAAATELLKLAINRLNKFYAHKLHKPAPKADRVQLLQADPVAEPFTSKLEKKQQGFNGVVSLIGSLITDLAKESQKANEVEELRNTKASLSASLTKSKEELASAVTSAAETAKVISSLHQSCDWLLQNFDTRKTARAGEVEALNNAKA